MLLICIYPHFVNSYYEIGFFDIPIMFFLLNNKYTFYDLILLENDKIFYECLDYSIRQCI